MSREIAGMLAKHFKYDTNIEQMFFKTNDFRPTKNYHVIAYFNLF
jgi:hypothetical protein